MRRDLLRKHSLLGAVQDLPGDVDGDDIDGVAGDGVDGDDDPYVGRRGRAQQRRAAESTCRCMAGNSPSMNMAG